MDIIEQQFDHIKPKININGSFWTGDIEKDDRIDSQSLKLDYISLAIIPLFFVDDIIGCIKLMSKQREYFGEDDIKNYEGLSRNLGIAIVNQRAHAALVCRHPPFAAARQTLHITCSSSAACQEWP